jgi:histone H1/5
MVRLDASSELRRDITRRGDRDGSGLGSEGCDQGGEGVARDIFGGKRPVPSNEDIEREAAKELERLTRQAGPPGAHGDIGGGGIGGPSLGPPSPLEQMAMSLTERKRTRRRRGSSQPAEDRKGFGGGFPGAAAITGSVGSSLGYGGGVAPGQRRVGPPADAAPLARRDLGGPSPPPKAAYGPRGDDGDDDGDDGDDDDLGVTEMALREQAERFGVGLEDMVIRSDATQAESMREQALRQFMERQAGRQSGADPPPEAPRLGGVLGRLENRRRGPDARAVGRLRGARIPDPDLEPDEDETDDVGVEGDDDVDLVEEAEMPDPDVDEGDLEEFDDEELGADEPISTGYVAANDERARLAERRASVAEERAGLAEERSGLAEERAAHAEARAEGAEQDAQQAFDRVAELEQLLADAEERAAQADERAVQAEERAAQAEERAVQAEAKPKAARPRPAKATAKATAKAPAKATAKATPAARKRTPPARPADEEEAADSPDTPRLGGVLGRRLAEQAAGPKKAAPKEAAPKKAATKKAAAKKTARKPAAAAKGARKR